MKKELLILYIHTASVLSILVASSATGHMQQKMRVNDVLNIREKGFDFVLVRNSDKDLFRQAHKILCA